jgi:hypothetical protein
MMHKKRILSAALLAAAMAFGGAVPATADTAASVSGQAAADTPAAIYAAAMRYTQDKLWSFKYATSSPIAAHNTERYFAGLVSASWALADQAMMLDTPVFSHANTIEGRPGLFNPDNRYLNALLEPGGSYRISGRRGTHADLTLQVLDGLPLAELGKNLLVIRPDQAGVKAGDEFEIYLGGKRRHGLWWPLPDRAKAMLVRESFGDWRESFSELFIERLDVPAARQPLQPARLAADYLRRSTDLWIDDYLKKIQRLAPLNSLGAPAPSREGLEGQMSVMARYSLAPGEGLLITVRKSGAGYQAIQLGDPWFVTPNFVRHQVSLTSRQARVDSDGLIRFVVALEDPGIPNWLDAAGNPQGYIFMRWQRLAQPLTAADAPVARIVKLKDLRELLPAETPQVSSAERAQQLAGRRWAPAYR